MARTFETSTSAARLGMDDPDRKSPAHDVACQYLAQPSLAKTIIGLCLEPHESPAIEKLTILNQWPKFEFMVTKGGGDYKTTVGFVDLLVVYRVDCPHFGGLFRVAFEVKTTPCSIGEVVRQIGLYREHFSEARDARWVLATTFEVSKHDVAMLAASSITHVRLGARFQRFFEEATSKSSIADSPVI